MVVELSLLVFYNLRLGQISLYLFKRNLFLMGAVLVSQSHILLNEHLRSQFGSYVD